VSPDPFKKLFESADSTREVSTDQIDKLVENSQIVQRVHDRVNGAPHRRKFHGAWGRVALASTAVVLVLGGAAAAITFLRSPVTNTSQMSCYSQDSLHSKVIAEMPYDSTPLASCKSELHWTSVPLSRTPAGLLCVLPNGTVAGFPPSKKYQSCSTIGLAIFNGKLKYPHVLDFQNAAHRYFEGNACPNVQSAKSRILYFIGKYGLRGWTVRTYGSSSPRSCATFGIQSAKRLIDVVGVDESK
jgi:hypothetical protein